MKYTCPCGRGIYSLIRGESGWFVALWMTLAVLWYGAALGLVVVGWWSAALVMVGLSTLLALIAPAVNGHREVFSHL